VSLIELRQSIALFAAGNQQSLRSSYWNGGDDCLWGLLDYCRVSAGLKVSNDQPVVTLCRMRALIGPRGFPNFNSGSTSS